jgi:2'-5' RNA ligase
MPVIRAFIAIETPKRIQGHLAGIIKDIKLKTQSNIIRWVSAENIHITLKFLGEISSANLDLLTKMVQQEVSRYPAFKLQVGGIGAFPTLLRPRVIWIGIDAPPTLFSLQNGVESETVHLGYTPEDRKFSPHLTIGRISHNASSDETHRIGQILSKFEPGEFGSYPVDSVILFKSDLLPGGAVYTPLATMALKSKIHSVI